MFQEARLTRTLRPLERREGEENLFEDIRTTLEEGTLITIGMPVKQKFRYRPDWYVPVFEDGKEKYFVPQDSIILE